VEPPRRDPRVHPTTSARPGIGNRALVIADRMGAVAFVELNTDGTPIGPLTVQKNMRVINQISQSIPLAPFWHHLKVRVCVLDALG